MLGRRGLLGGLLLMGMPRRPDQSYDPPGNAAPVSSQAGIFRGRLVVVTGPNGAVIGMFVYAAGTTPSLGNPPIASMTNSTVDPFGNPVQDTIAAYGPTVAGGVSPATIFLSASPDLSLTFKSGAASEFQSAFIANGVVNAGTPTTEIINYVISGPVNGTVQDFCSIQMSDSAAGFAPAAEMFLTYNDTTGGPHILFDGTVTGASLPLTSQMVGVEPGTSGTTMQPEIWHTLVPVAGFTAGTPGPRYRFEPVGPAGQVRLDGQVALTANQAANTTFFTLPAGYHPSRAKVLVIGNNLSGATAVASDLSVSTAGVMQITQAGTNGNIMNLDGVTFPLD